MGQLDCSGILYVFRRKAHTAEFLTVGFSGKEQVAAISAGISCGVRSQGLAQITAEGLAYFTGDKYLLITNITRANSMLQKLYFKRPEGAGKQ